MATPLVRLQTQLGAIYVRPGYVHLIASSADRVDERGIAPQSVVQVLVPDVAHGQRGAVQVYDSIGWVVLGTPDEVSAALWPAGART